MTRPVLLVDDDALILELMSLELDAEGISRRTAITGAEALQAVKDEPVSVIVLDLCLPDVEGTELLQTLRKRHPDVPVIMATAEGDVEKAVECMRLGAADYVHKPFDRQRLITSIQNARLQGDLQRRVDSLTHQLRDGDGFAIIIGQSSAIRDCTDIMRRAAERSVTVLLTGESGTGKEVAARAIHTESTRAGGPFVAVNCGAIPEGLIETELFGHEKGAFTGADVARAGCFERADGGTIFLDEVGELRTDLQVRLLRVLQEQIVRRVGDSRDRKIDVRVIAATNRDLKAAIADGGFREDLYYRLSVFPVQLPPLRDREDDVLLLAEHFLRRFTERHGRSISAMQTDTLAALQAYTWPGNVRELENVIERAVILEDGPLLGPDCLPRELGADPNPAKLLDPSALDSADGNGSASTNGSSNGHAHTPSNGEARNGAESALRRRLSADDILPFAVEERRILQRALELTNWRIKDAADRLGIGRATLYRKIERYGMR